MMTSKTELERRRETLTRGMTPEKKRRMDASHRAWIAACARARAGHVTVARVRKPAPQRRPGCVYL